MIYEMTYQNAQNDAWNFAIFLEQGNPNTFFFLSSCYFFLFPNELLNAQAYIDIYQGIP